MTTRHASLGSFSCARFSGSTLVLGGLHDRPGYETEVPLLMTLLQRGRAWGRRCQLRLANLNAADYLGAVGCSLAIPAAAAVRMIAVRRSPA